MNVDTGEFYRGAALFKAIQRGEPIEDLTLRVPIEDRSPEEEERIIAQTRSFTRINWVKRKVAR